MPTIKIITSRNGEVIKETEYEVTEEQALRFHNFFKEMREKKEQRQKEQAAKAKIYFNQKQNNL